MSILNIGDAEVWMPNTIQIGGQQNIHQLIKSLFASNEQGFAYDPNDLTTMFQDAAGTIPVTGSGQPVGLSLDKSRVQVSTPRRNLLSCSENFSRPEWTRVSVSSVVDSNGYKITNSGSGGYINQTPSALSTVAVRTATFIIGAAASKFVHLKVASVSAGANNAGVVVDTVNKLITATTTGGSGYSVLSSSLQVLPDGTLKVVITTQGNAENQRVVMNSVATSDGVTVGASGHYFYLVSAQLENGNTATEYQKVDSPYGGWVAGNHAYQATSSMRPLLQESPRRVDYDAVDDNLITNLPAQLTGCTVVRAVPNVGTQILTNQTIPTPYNDNTDHCGLIVINRALTATETSQITKLFNKAAGV